MIKMKNINYIFCAIFLLVFFAGCQKKKDATEKPCCTESVVLESKNAKLSNESIYQLESKWQDQNAKALTLSSLSGKIQIAAMIFTSCKQACPRLMVDLKVIESKLSAEQKKQVSFLLISFDAENDTPKQLKKFANDMRLNENWKLISSSEESIRELSLVLDINYEKQSDGTFAHSNAIHVINQKGEIIHRQEGLGSNSTPTLSAIEKALATP